ncbi:Protein WHAT'S THIS FACTOR 1 homolog, chloroplastic [Linum perenne]
MDLQKKPSVILQLKSIIQSHKHRRILLRDLEKEVGFVHKWNFMTVIEKYPSIFNVGGGSDKTPPFVTLTERAAKIAREESEARALMEPTLVRNLRKLLMMSVDCRLPLEKVELIGNELGLPQDFSESLIPKLELQGVPVLNPSRKLVRISKDGNYLGPELERWQRLDFPSPYLNPRTFEAADPKARKRVVSVLHELLSLTMAKRMTSSQLDAFHSEYLFPSRKEAYDGTNLITKCPLLSLNDKFVALSGRRVLTS